MLDLSQYLPARQALTGGPGDAVADRLDDAGEPAELIDQCGTGTAGLIIDLDNKLSYR